MIFDTYSKEEQTGTLKHIRKTLARIIMLITLIIFIKCRRRKAVLQEVGILKPRYKLNIIQCVIRSYGLRLAKLTEENVDDKGNSMV